MNAEKGYCMVLCTSPDEQHAENLADLLIGEKLAACVQLVPIRSFYQWKGKICRDEERLLLIKTRAALYGDLEKLIISNHPYEVPEILRFDIDSGLGSYLAWMDSVTGLDPEI